MASNICRSLLEKNWKSYARDLDKAPHVEGIYTIGHAHGNDVQYIYVGYSNNINRRLKEHAQESRKQEIDEIVKSEFRRNVGQNLRIKWKEVEDGKCVEGDYVACMERELGYQLQFNITRGNKCN